MCRFPQVGSLTLPLIVIAVATALQGQQAEPVAGVLDVNGSWQLDSQQTPVKAGQKLYPGNKLSTAEYNYDNSITIVQYDDGSRTRIACENSPKNPCRSPFVVSPPESNPESQLPSLIKAAFDLLVGNPPAVLSHDSATIGRGKYVVVLREDVVNLDGGKGLTLNGRVPVLPAGVYSVEALKSDGSQTPIKLQLNTDAYGSWQPSIPVTRPGLYTIMVKDSDGELRADLAILFVSSSRYDDARQSFDAVRNKADTWHGTNAQTDEHTLLRAILIAMSKPR